MITFSSKMYRYMLKNKFRREKVYCTPYSTRKISSLSSSAVSTTVGMFECVTPAATNLRLDPSLPYPTHFLSPSFPISCYADPKSTDFKINLSQIKLEKKSLSAEQTKQTKTLYNISHERIIFHYGTITSLIIVTQSEMTAYNFIKQSKLLSLQTLMEYPYLVSIQVSQ